MRDYGKVHTSFWSSATIRELSEDGRMLAMYLLSSPHGNIAGVFRIPDGYVCEDLQWSSERVSKGFTELFQKGFANRCETTKWVWIIKHFEWNPLENPNQRKSATKISASIPDGCGWKLDFMRVCGGFMGVDSPPKTNPSETVSKPFLNQEQEQEQDKNTEPDGSVASRKPATGLPPCPIEQVVDVYHELLPELPRVRLMDDTRKRSISRMWRWVLTSKKPDGTRRAETADEAVGWVQDFFGRARDNDFLMGRGSRANGHENWRCDLDFLLSVKGMKHVIEKTGGAA